MTYLLPPNATAQERALEDVMRLPAEVLAGADAVRTTKENPPDDWLLWLVWEYGLEELLPYLPDPRRAIAEGVQFQRIRGTPASLRMALGWIGADAAIEEEETGGAHWHEFQLDPGMVPNGDMATEQVQAIAQLAAPVGTRLTRIYHGHDVRRLVLDRSEYGAILSDYSGARRPDGLRLSFGRWSGVATPANLPTYAGTLLVREHASLSAYQDRPLLDFAQFGEVPVLNHGATHLHMMGSGSAWAGTEQVVVMRRFSRASLVLGEAEPLGSTNATFPPRRGVEDGQAPQLNATRLSDELWHWQYHPVDERFDRGYSVEVVWQLAAEPPKTAANRLHCTGSTGADNFPVLSGVTWYNPYHASGSVRVHGVASIYKGQTWAGNKWPAKRWRDVNVLIGTAHYGNSD